jgi:hypothetical protein
VTASNQQIDFDVSAFEQRKLAHAQASARMFELQTALKARLGATLAETSALDAHRALPMPWVHRWTPGQGIPSLERWPALADFLDHALSTDASDAHFELRGQNLSLRLRADGQMHEWGRPPDAAHIHAQLLDFLRAQGLSFPDPIHPSNAAPEIDAPGAPIKLRLQSMLAHPEGMDIILRILPSQPELSPEMAKLRDERSAEGRQLVARWRGRLLDNRREHQEECARAMGPSDDLLHRAFFSAIEAGQRAEVQKLLTAGADPHWRQWRTNRDAESLGSHISMATPLILAARLGHADVVQTLLPVSDIDAVDAQGDTALIACAQNGHADIAAMLAPRALLDAQNFDGSSALFEAAWMDHPEVVALLAPVSEVNLGQHCFGSTALGAPDPGRTALSIAAQEGFVEACKILLAHGADPRLKQNNGENAVQMWTRGEDDLAELLGAQAAKLDELDALRRETPLATWRQSAPRL